MLRRAQDVVTALVEEKDREHEDEGGVGVRGREEKLLGALQPAARLARRVVADQAAVRGEEERREQGAPAQLSAALGPDGPDGRGPRRPIVRVGHLQNDPPRRGARP